MMLAIMCNEDEADPLMRMIRQGLVNNQQQTMMVKYFFFFIFFLFMYSPDIIFNHSICDVTDF